ncbi:MAG: CaiB/BaiF CoA transferase family protein [Hyphomicrobiaceae bacterium]
MTIGPLAGIKVLDATQGVAGPHAGMLLAQNGADVVKLEPLDGDWGRTLGKRYGDLSAQAIVFNRGKKSIAVDLKADEGRKIAQKLAVSADIVLESYRPGVMKKLGLGYEDIRTRRPDIIYLSITGFGQNGPYSGLPVTDSVIQAFSGWMTLHRDDAGTPMRSGIIAIDVMTGLYAYQAIASALIGRLRGGGGAYIDCSMLQSAAAFQAAKSLEYFLEDGKPEVSYVPVGVMPTADGYINISAMRDAHYAALCKVLGRPDLAVHPKYDTRDKRRAHKDEVMALLRQEFAKRETAHWQRELTAAGVMNAVINTYGEFLADPHVKEIGTMSYVDHGALGTAPAANIPGVPAFGSDARGACPSVGQHTREVLASNGYDDTGIDALVAAGVVKQA